MGWQQSHFVLPNNNFVKPCSPTTNNNIIFSPSSQCQLSNSIYGLKFAIEKNDFKRLKSSSGKKRNEFVANPIYPSGFLHTHLPYINFRLAISKVITIPITLSKFKSNFPLGLFSFSHAVPSIPVVFQYFGIKFQRYHALYSSMLFQ